MLTGSGEFTYEWISDWAKVPDSRSAREGWAHHGMTVTGRGEVIACHPGEPKLLAFDPDGNLRRSFSIPAREAHQLALSSGSSEEFLWVADPGRKNVRNGDVYGPVMGERGGQVLKLTMDGDVRLRIGKPALAIYESGPFAPTSVTVAESGRGGNGDIWVADGYGQSYVHRYNADGDYHGSISGEEGAAGRFSCPHSVWVDYRKPEPELYIADRTNRRVQVYDLDGGYKRSFGQGVLTSPSSFALDGDYMIVAELRARLAVFDAEDRFVTYIGENERISRVERNSPEDVPGWPNNLDSQGRVIRSRILENGKFNSPHGIATDTHGNIYSGEWLIGGRYTKLVKQK